MIALRWFLFALFLITCGLGCESKPDNDPKVEELKEPTIQSGADSGAKADAPK
jgi:hypothetical protein